MVTTSSIIYSIYWIMSRIPPFKYFIYRSIYVASEFERVIKLEQLSHPTSTRIDVSVW